MTADEPNQADAELTKLHQIEAGAPNDSPDPAFAEAAPGTRAETPEPSKPAKEEPAPLERITAGDKSRAAIAERFKQGRGQGLDFHGDYRDPSQRYGQYGAPAIEGRDDAPAVGAEPGIPADQHQDIVRVRAAEAGDPEQTAPDALQRVIVHGVEMWLTPDQVVAEAQKSLAAGNILESAKQIKDAVSRSTASRPHPGGDVPRSEASGRDQNPHQGQDPYDDLVHELQFGDPNRATQRLRETIATDARAAALAALIHERFGNERSHRIRALADFTAANAELRDDPLSTAAITQQVNREYLADLRAIGVADDQLPATATEIADWHMQARVQGKPVREISAIFDASKQKFLDWRGTAGAAGHAPAPDGRQHDRQSQPPSRPTAPRVELSPDRTQRRAAVPTQPVRASVPPRQPAAVLPGGDRSAAIMNMRRARGQPVG